MAKTILVVDDTESLRTLVKSYLTQEGFRVLTAADGRQALFLARDEKPDLILLDLMMPEMGGYEFMRVYGREAETPIIILTARVEENEKVLGLELGADDYVTKPFNPREVVARVKAILRRMRPPRTDDGAMLLRVGGLTLDPNAHAVSQNGTPIPLTPSEFDILHLLMRNPGRAYSRAQLIDDALGYAYAGVERTVDSHIKNLRRKLEPDPRSPTLIETVFGVGYRLHANPTSSAP